MYNLDIHIYIRNYVYTRNSKSNSNLLILPFLKKGSAAIFLKHDV